MSEVKFKVSTFYVIIDQLNNALKQRIKSYLFELQCLGVLTQFDSMSDEDIKLHMKDLLIYIQKISLSNSIQNSDSMFVGTRNSQKNASEKCKKMQQKRVNRHCSTYLKIVAYKWSLHCIPK